MKEINLSVKEPSADRTGHQISIDCIVIDDEIFSALLSNVALAVAKAQKDQRMTNERRVKERQNEAC